MLRSLAILCTLGATLSACDKAPGTYAAACATPLPNWKTEKDGVGHLTVLMSVYLGSDGTLLWNKNAISNEKLRFYMMEVSGLNPRPQIVLEVSPAASCHRVNEVRFIMNSAPLCKANYSLCSEGWNPKEWPMLGGP